MSFGSLISARAKHSQDSFAQGAARRQWLFLTTLQHSNGTSVQIILVSDRAYSLLDRASFTAFGQELFACFNLH